MTKAFQQRCGLAESECEELCVGATKKRMAGMPTQGLAAYIQNQQTAKGNLASLQSRSARVSLTSAEAGQVGQILTDLCTNLDHGLLPAAHAYFVFNAAIY